MAKKDEKKEAPKKAAPKKAPVKKATAKKVVEPQKEIKAQMVAKNLVCMIDGQKKVLKNPSDADVKIISNKVKLYNKKNSDTLLEEIILLVDKTVAEDNTKVAKTKGLEKIIKKEGKAKGKKEAAVAPTLSLAEQIKAKLASNDLSEQERKELRGLLKEEKEEAAVAPVATQTSSPSRRER